MDTLLKIKNITDGQGNSVGTTNEDGSFTIPKGTIISKDWRIVLDTGNPYKALEEVIEFEKSTDPIAMEIKKMRAEFEESLGC